jgi:endonuclease YncB( thermonuclease family)
VISAILPNPSGEERAGEWVELRNLELRPLSLEGWTLVAGTKTHPLSAITLSPLESRRLSGLSFQVKNEDGSLMLLDPGGAVQSILHWKKAKEKEIIRLSRRIERIAARVLRVIDGDTIEVDLAPAPQRVRFLGIDTLELTSNDPRVAALARRALEFLRRQLREGGKIELAFDAAASEHGFDELGRPRDAYGRLLAHVFTASGSSVEEMLLREGLAIAERRFTFALKDAYLAFEKEARLARKGIWHESSLPASELWKFPRTKSERRSHPRARNRKHMPRTEGSGSLLTLSQSPNTPRENRPLEFLFLSFLGASFLLSLRHFNNPLKKISI